LVTFSRSVGKPTSDDCHQLNGKMTGWMISLPLGHCANPPLIVS